MMITKSLRCQAGIDPASRAFENTGFQGFCRNACAVVFFRVLPISPKALNRG